ncbi:MAG: hypothetical protein JKY50_03010 [Oleispira sp.]|nr:hypothetical protein [Oleispira sp.]MBL4880079.1 hypothetical protein [Oleispira sp.]
MKNIIFILLSFSIIFESFAAVTGAGRGSLGASLDKEDISTGIEGTYVANAKTHSNELEVFFDFEKVFDDGRVAPVSGHSYQYNSAYVNTVIDHKYSTASPYLNWQSTAQYYYDLDSLNSVPQSWALLTGPKYTKNIRPDIALDLQVQKAKQLDNQYLSDETSGVVNLSKKINSRIVIAGEFERYCTDYDDNDVIDSCSNETSGEISVNLGSGNYRIRIGSFVVHDEAYPTYEVDYDYKLNRSNQLFLRYGKKNNSIRNNVLTRTSSLPPDPATFTTSLIGRYLYDFKRIKVLMEVKSTETENDTSLIQQQRYSAQADYRLLTNRCRGCLLHLSFDRDNNEVSNWHSTSLGIDIPWIKEFYNQFAIRYTNNENSGSFYSLVWIINYNGRPSILSR